MAKKVTKKVTGASGVNGYGAIPKTLSELRSQFDGFRDVAAKLEDGPIKTKLMNSVENLYLAAGNWFTGIHTNATETHA